MKRLSAWSVVVLLALPAAAVACPFCKDAAPATGPAGGVDAAASPLFNTSIYFMLGGLFAAFGLVGRAIVKGIRSGS